MTEPRLADNRNAALNTTEDWVQRFPNLKGIYSATDDIGAGVVDGLKASNKLGQVKVSTSNLSPTAQKMLASGEFVCTAIQQIVLQGRVALEQAVKAAKGEKTEASVATPAVLVTKDNMSTIIAAVDEVREGGWAASATDELDDPRERRRCSAWRYGAVYKEWCRCLGALPVPNAGQWLGSTPAGCEVFREACRNESSALDHGLPTSALDGDTIM